MIMASSDESGKMMFNFKTQQEMADKMLYQSYDYFPCHCKSGIGKCLLMLFITPITYFGVATWVNDVLYRDNTAEARKKKCMATFAIHIPHICWFVGMAVGSWMLRPKASIYIDYLELFYLYIVIWYFVHVILHPLNIKTKVIMSHPLITSVSIVAFLVILVVHCCYRICGDTTVTQNNVYINGVRRAQNGNRNEQDNQTDGTQNNDVPGQDLDNVAIQNNLEEVKDCQ